MKSDWLILLLLAAGAWWLKSRSSTQTAPQPQAPVIATTNPYDLTTAGPWGVAY